jgi:hypothetical protein
MTNSIEHLATRFSRSETDYKEAEQIWRHLWSRALAAVPVESDWQTPWFKPIANWHEGNPILSAISPDSRRAVRVIIHEPTDDPSDRLESWIDRREVPERGVYVTELVIDCVLNRQALMEAEILITEWLSGRYESSSPTQMVTTMDSTMVTSVVNRVAA